MSLQELEQAVWVFLESLYHLILMFWPPNRDLGRLDVRGIYHQEQTPSAQPKWEPGPQAELGISTIPQIQWPQPNKERGLLAELGI